MSWLGFNRSFIKNIPKQIYAYIFLYIYKLKQKLLLLLLLLKLLILKRTVEMNVGIQDASPTVNKK